MLLIKVWLAAAVCRLFKALSLAAAAASFGVENVAQLCIALLPSTAGAGAGAVFRTLKKLGVEAAGGQRTGVLGPRVMEFCAANQRRVSCGGSGQCLKSL